MKMVDVGDMNQTTKASPALRLTCSLWQYLHLYLPFLLFSKPKGSVFTNGMQRNFPFSSSSTEARLYSGRWWGGIGHGGGPVG